MNQKLTRSRELLAEFVAAADDYVTAAPARLVDELRPGALVTAVRIHPEPPSHLSLLAGDAVHNARSALDHVITQYAPEERRRACMFPIANDLDAFANAANRWLRDVPQEVRDAVHALAPYRSRSPDLWLLNDLDAIDKHVIPLGIVGSFGGMTIGIPDLIGLEISWPRGTLRDGQAVMTMSGGGQRELEILQTMPAEMVRQVHFDLVIDRPDCWDSQAVEVVGRVLGAAEAAAHHLMALD